MKSSVKVTIEQSDGVTASINSLTYYEEDGDLPDVEEVLSAMIDNGVCNWTLLKSKVENHETITEPT